MKKTPDGDVWATDDDLALDERVDWAEIAEKITSNPGHWLLAKRGGSRSFVWKINNGRFSALNIPGYTVTATSRNVRPNGKSDLWVKAEVDS